MKLEINETRSMDLDEFGVVHEVEGALKLFVHIAFRHGVGVAAGRTLVRVGRIVRAALQTTHTKTVAA